MITQPEIDADEKILNAPLTSAFDVNKYGERAIEAWPQYLAEVKRLQKQNEALKEVVEAAKVLRILACGTCHSSKQMKRFSKALAKLEDGE